VRIVRTSSPGGEVPRNAVATVGNYDGIHLGQRAVLDRVVERARSLGTPSIAITFDPHPLRLLAPARAPRRLTTEEQRARLLGDVGLDALLVLPFTRELAATPAEEFVRRVLGAELEVREIFVGSTFAFGHGRKGDLALLRRLGRELGFAATGVPELELDGAPVSATRIRRALDHGRADEAARLLGRAYSILGTVEHGDRRGSEIGFPTLNLGTENEILPAHGVYVARTTFADRHDRFPGVANVGLRPTIGKDLRPLAEVHLFDFERDCYGARVEVEFLQRLRPEHRFASLEELREQIGRDARSAREYFARSERSPGGGAAVTAAQAPPDTTPSH
jgi:riboflavin kinase / FMN adenylyltransferase